VAQRGFGADGSGRVENAPKMPEVIEPERDDQKAAVAQRTQQQSAEPADCIEEKDVPPPEQQVMQRAQQHQPEQPARLQRIAVAPGGFGALPEQDQPGAEQQREQCAHLAFEKQERESEGGFVDRRDRLRHVG